MSELAAGLDRRQAARGSVLVAYAVFILVGLVTGVGGVLILAQMADYGVDRATIGLTFFTFSAGFVLAGITTGPLLHRFGTRLALLGGGIFFAVAGIGQAIRPAFVVFVFVQVVAGYAIGLLESVLNAHLSTLPRATTLLNRLHAFFGVGALIGPIAATWMLRFTTWPAVLLALTVVGALTMVAVWFAYPDRRTDPLAVTHEPASAAPDRTAAAAREHDRAARRGLLPTVLRQPAVLLGALLLTVYVGLEIGVGNWGVAYLLDARAASDLVAGYTLSLYWLGLTLGRFVISPAAARLGLTTVGMMYTCIIGISAASALVWLVPSTAVAPVGFVLLGFFLGPIFPTTMAVVPSLTEPRLVPTAMGVINAGSVVGGSGLPWLAGALGQGVGAWTLLPFAFTLALLHLLVWWRMVGHMNPQTAALRRLADSPASP
jgi:fucose permease